MKHVIITLFVGSVLAACSFGVDVVSSTPTATTPAAPFDTIAYAQAGDLDQITIRGTNDPDVRASADVSMLVSDSATSHATDFAHLQFTSDSTTVSPVLAVDPVVGEDPPDLHLLTVTIPPAYAVHLSLSSTSASVAGMLGDVTADSTSGSVDLATQGSITATSTSGSMRAIAGGHLDLHATSGSVDAQGDGGSIVTVSGSIDVVWTGATLEPLTLGATSGSIRVGVPANVGFHLHANVTSGSIHINGLDVAVNESSMVDVDVHGGGPLLAITTTSGSIAVGVTQ